MIRPAVWLVFFMLACVGRTAVVDIHGLAAKDGKPVVVDLMESDDGWRVMIPVIPRYVWRLADSGNRIELDIYGLTSAKPEIMALVDSERIAGIAVTRLSRFPVKSRLSVVLKKRIDPRSLRVEHTLDRITVRFGNPGVASPPVDQPDEPSPSVTRSTDAPSERKSAPPKSEQIDPGDYEVGIGDLIEVRTEWTDGDSESAEFIVTSRGIIDHPLIGEVEINGKRIGEIEKLLQEKLKPYLRNYKIVVNVKEYRSKWILVLGQVAKETRVPWRGPIRLFDLLEEVGGWKDTADLARIQIYGKGESKPIQTSISDNPLVPPNSIVNVPPKSESDRKR